MAVFTMPSEQYQTDLSQIPFRECFTCIELCTNKHSKSFLLYNKDWYFDIFQKDHNYSTSSTSKSPFNKCIEITSGKKICFVPFLVNNIADFNKLQAAFG